MNYHKCQEAYHNDTTFHSLVDALIGLIEKLEMTPSEIREAATFAAILFEQTRCCPTYVVPSGALDREQYIKEGLQTTS